VLAAIGGDIDSAGDGVKGPDRAAVRDDEDPTSGMAGCEPADSRHHAVGKLVVGFAVVPGDGPLEPSAKPGRKAAFRLLARQAGPGAHVDLAELAQPFDFEPMRLSDCRGGFPRATQVACVHSVERDVRQARAELLGMPAPPLRQGPVRVPLEPACGVPIALAVACQEDDRRAHGRPAYEPGKLRPAAEREGRSGSPGGTPLVSPGGQRRSKRVTRAKRVVPEDARFRAGSLQRPSPGTH